ncbi:MAG TPA: DUF4124 domain-containing protein [Candidatus Binatia bacterium]|nr:DUF4124 domain-containing protein [Candidatus Binatia bacterium]
MWTVGSMVAVLALAVPVLADDVFRWTDAAGRIHYSNSPSGASDATAVISGGFLVPREPEPPPPPLDAGEAASTDGDADDEESAKAAPAGDPDTLSAAASLRRNGLERDLRATDKRIADIDRRLGGLARTRGDRAASARVTTGIGTNLDVRSDEERALGTERDQLAQHAAEVRNEAANLRAEVTKRAGGTTPDWWVDLR